MRKLIAASILSADFTRLGEEIKSAEESGVDWVHFDVMDGCFVPNISFGVPVLQSIRRSTKLPFDVHLMVSDPARYVRVFREAGADLITVHAETCGDLGGCLDEIRGCGAKAGVSINPKTPVEEAARFLEKTDLILLMGVEPGFGGQKFNHEVLGKIAEARKLIDERNLDTYLEVDGGVNTETAPKIVGAGADVIVAGSYIFRHPRGVKAAVSELRKTI